MIKHTGSLVCQANDTSKSMIPKNLRIDPVLHGMSSPTLCRPSPAGQPRMQAGMGDGSGSSPVGRAAVGLLLVVVILPQKHFDSDSLAFHLIVVESVVNHGVVLHPVVEPKAPSGLGTREDVHRRLDIARPLPGENCVLAHEEELQIAVILAAEIVLR